MTNADRRAAARRLSDHLDRRGAHANTPPANVLIRTSTRADVHAFPDYFILGAGRDLAANTDCEHGYRLTDSCPHCD